MEFKDKVVVITGSSSGIGAATAVAFAKLSAKVVIIGRKENQLETVSKLCEEIKGVKPLVIKAELTNDAELKRIVDETVKKFGQIDILVNNAGVGGVAGLNDGIEHYDKIMSTNVRSVYLLTSLVVPYLIKTKGNIVNVSSIAAKKPLPDFLSYCISKAGLDMFTKCIAKQLARDGVRVNSVNPGTVKTNFQTACGMTQTEADDFLESRAETSPLGKIATSEEVADLITYLASDKAKSITGSIYFIENGQLFT